MAVAFIQEFPIEPGDTSTTNYDKVAAMVDLRQAPEGLLIHTAGFDRDAGVFRILDVWESREQGETFIAERLEPVLESLIAAARESGDASFTPPGREGWYELHDVRA